MLIKNYDEHNKELTLEQKMDILENYEKFYVIMNENLIYFYQKINRDEWIFIIIKESGSSISTGLEGYNELKSTIVNCQYVASSIDLKFNFNVKLNKQRFIF